MTERTRNCATCRHFGEPANYFGREMGPCIPKAIRSKAGLLLAERLTAPEASCAEWAAKIATWEDTTEPGAAP